MPHNRLQEGRINQDFVVNFEQELLNITNENIEIVKQAFRNVAKAAISEMKKGGWKDHGLYLGKATPKYRNSFRVNVTGNTAINMFDHKPIYIGRIRNIKGQLTHILEDGSDIYTFKPLQAGEVRNPLDRKHHNTGKRSRAFPHWGKGVETVKQQIIDEVMRLSNQ